VFTTSPDVHQRRGDRLDLAHLSVEIFDVGTLRRADGDRDDAAVLRRRQLLGQQRVGKGGGPGEE
jgi:hypothetical protein